MIREGLICGAAVVISLSALDRGGRGLSISEGFERGIARSWVRQEVDGTLDTVPATGRDGQALRARAAPRRGRVPKAALIARTAPIVSGQRVRVAFDLFVPAGTPINSLQIVDLECATCGEGGNPGIRLYLRRGRLRIDRSKIGIARAWMNDAAPALSADRWHRIGLDVLLGAQGRARVTLDGREVLVGEGATLLPGADHLDRIQIGITANSNAVPATLLVDNIAISTR
ncbi:hypothetical protein [Sphingomonas sp.]|uniref:hypothetical protein n=1 Tax=Sphingomonas sp. TaxID=28214 RepID=UPI0035C7978D